MVHEEALFLRKDFRGEACVYVAVSSALNRKIFHMVLDFIDVMIVEVKVLPG